MAIIALQATRGVFPQQWLILDYAQRLAALAILAASPRLRGLMPLGRPRWIDLALTAGLLLLGGLGVRYLEPALSTLLGGPALFSFPDIPDGPLRLLDQSFGLMLVGYQEEVVFTATLVALLEQRLRPAATVAVVCLIFAANHWSQHWGTMVSAGLIHVPFVLAYLWRRSLLPLAAAHWLTDIIAFS